MTAPEKLRSVRVVGAIVIAAVSISVPLAVLSRAERADAITYTKLTKLKHSKKLAGKYTGITEEGGTVSYRLTRSAKVVGFVITDVKVECETTPQPGQPPPPGTERVLPQVTMPTTRMRGVSKSHPLGKKLLHQEFFPQPYPTAFQQIYVDGRFEDLVIGTVVAGVGMAGNVNFGITNGPENAPGTEACVSKFVDWAAKKKGMAGSLADQLSPPGAPPAS